MAYDPELVAETRSWVVKAAQDLGAGTHVLRAQPPFTGDAVFHAQQAAEKSLKAFLTWHGRPFGKTHNLTELGDMCSKRDGSLERLLKTSSRLTEYAWKFRYPGEPEGPGREEAEEALGIARQVYEAILARLPEEARP